MTNNWFECKVKYVKIDENGKEKKVTEPYLVDAVSFTEAEARIHTELEKMIHSDFITNVSHEFKTPLSTILGLEIIPVIMFLGVICVALGIFLVGKSSLVHMGWIGVKIAHHPVVILGSVSLMCILFYWWLMYGT